MDKITNAIKFTKEYFLMDEKPWVIGFSGGKDSSLVVKLLLTAISQLPFNRRRLIKVLYCDTGVEIPVVRNYIKETLFHVQSEGKELGIEIESIVVKPAIDNLFFVKVIGRGYPPPTNKFRWCTDKLRIEPIQLALKKTIGDRESIVVLGTRYGESEERNKILIKHSTVDPLLFRQSRYANTKLFCPIVDFTTEDVWEALVTLDLIKSIDIQQLSDLYRKISGECPIIRLPDVTPCSRGRFGCWTCTVVRQDKATQNLISSGFKSLVPLLNFRTWLLQIRDSPEFRCTIRRNGIKGLGPFRLSARKIIFEKLLAVQEESGHNLIDEIEIAAIKRWWKQDEQSTDYRENFA
jgi:DNA sulfur modification protein DndC